jgi:beta-glucosidase
VLSAPDPAAEVLGSPATRALAREVAARSVVVLRNEPVDEVPVLPFAGTEVRVAVLGRLADAVNLGDGGSSDVWDVECKTILDGLRDAVDQVVHDDGRDVERAAAIAADADVAIVVVGYTYLDEGEYIGETDASLPALFPSGDEPHEVDLFQELLTKVPPITKPERLTARARGFAMGGDRTSLRLSDADVDLIRAVAASNPRTVVVIQAGSAVVASEWLDAVPAVVQAWYGGCEAGPGLADVLLGAVNPSARLPFSVPTDEADLPAFERNATRFRYDRWHGWWHLARNGSTPAFPFGFGLSYTTFALADIDVAVDGQQVRVRGAVRNTGDRDGADVVQVYAELPDPESPPRLVGFARVEVGAHDAAGFEILVPVDRLATRDPERRAWRPGAGHHRFRIARFVGDPDATTVAIGL